MSSSILVIIFFLQNCKGKGKTVLTEADLVQYGIKVSKPICKAEEDDEYESATEKDYEYESGVTTDNPFAKYNNDDYYDNPFAKRSNDDYYDSFEVKGVQSA